MVDDTTVAVPALVMPADGLSVVVRMAVRGAIEAAVEHELTAALGRAAWERAAAVTGYRHGAADRGDQRGGRHPGPPARSAAAGRWDDRGMAQRGAPALCPADEGAGYHAGPVVPERGKYARSATGARAAVGDDRAVEKRGVAGRHPAAGRVPDVAPTIAGGRTDRVPHPRWAAAPRAGRWATGCSVLMAVGVRTTGEKVVLALRVAGANRRRRGASCWRI